MSSKQKSPSSKKAAGPVAAKGESRNTASKALCLLALFAAMAAIVYSRFNNVDAPAPIEDSDFEAVDLDLCLDRARLSLAPKHRVNGFHVLCVAKEKNSLKFTGFRDGQANPVAFDIQVSKAGLSAGVFRKGIEKGLAIKSQGKERPEWQAYTAEGKLIETPSQAVKSQLVFIYEGGVWIWPGIEIGHKTVVPLPGGDNATLETVSMVPLVFSITAFLTEPECDTIISISRPHMEASGVAHQDRDVGKPSSEWRTSTQYWLHNSLDTPLTRKINARVESLTHIPVSFQEDSVQVLSYELTQHYDSHTDYFDAELYKNSPEYKTYLRSNRVATVFWYMSDVEEGGETVFPRFGGAPIPNSYKDCSIGLRVRPEKGKVILFYSMTPDGNVDPYSLHGGCPVIKGRKWAANKWIWNRPRQ